MIAAAVVVALGGCGGETGDAGSVALGEGDPDAGRELYATHCVSCHGDEGLGSTTGPPLVTELYAPPELGDQDVANAITEGVAQQHWEFGPMPGTPGLGSQEVADLVAYVRALQRDAGLLE